MKRRILSILLSTSMIFSSVSLNVISVFAEEPSDDVLVTSLEEETDSETITTEPEDAEADAVEIIPEEKLFQEVTEKTVEEVDFTEEEVSSEEETLITEVANASSRTSPWNEDFDGEVYNLTLGEDITITPESTDYVWFAFTPSESGKYHFLFLNDDPSVQILYAYLYDCDGSRIAYYDYYSANQKVINKNLSDDELYYIRVELYSWDGGLADYTVSVSQALVPVEIQEIYGFPEKSPLYLSPVLTGISADILYSDGTVQTLKYGSSDRYGNKISYTTPEIDYCTESDIPVTISIGDVSVERTMSIVSWDKMEYPQIDSGTTTTVDGSVHYVTFTAPSTATYSITLINPTFTWLYSENIVDDDPNLTDEEKHLITYRNHGDTDATSMNLKAEIAEGETVLLKYIKNSSRDEIEDVQIGITEVKEVSSISASVSGTVYLEQNIPSLSYTVQYTDGTSETGTTTDLIWWGGDFLTPGGTLLRAYVSYNTFTDNNGRNHSCAGPATLHIICNNSYETETEVPIIVTPRVEDFYSSEATISGTNGTVQIPSFSSVNYNWNYFVKITPTETAYYEIVNDDDHYNNIYLYDENDRLIYSTYRWDDLVTEPLLEAGHSYLLEVYQSHGEAGSVTFKKADMKLQILEQPQDVRAGVKNTVSYHVEAKHAASYQWEYTKNGKTWYKSSAASATTDTLTFKVSTSNAANLYRCQVTGLNGDVLYTDTAGIDLIPGVVITKQPSSVTGKIGQTVTYTVTADNVDSYQWLYSKDGTNWYKSSATGCTTDTLSIKISSTNKNYYYKCKMMGIDGNAKNSAKAGVVIVTAQPKTCTAAVGTTASYTVVAENISTYQWQYSKNNGEKWYNSSATGYDTDTISFKATTTNRETIYRCKLTNTNGLSAYTTSAGFAEGMKIINQPENVAGSIGDKVTFTVDAQNVNAYQWQYSKDGNKWYNSGATGNGTASVQITVSTANVNNVYRCKLTGADGSVKYTNVVGVQTA